MAAWNEPGRIYFPGEPEPTTRAQIPHDAARASITRVVTETGQTTPRVETLGNNILDTPNILTCSILPVGADYAAKMQHNPQFPRPPKNQKGNRTRRVAELDARTMAKRRLGEQAFATDAHIAQLKRDAVRRLGHPEL